MRFGAVSLEDAEGAILAHSVQVGGRRLRKGLVLGAAEVAAMRAEGLAQVVVARPDPGDLAEDTAARDLSAALAGAEGIALAEAFTGRVNVTAAHAGVARINAAAIGAVNQINPMITVATVPECHQLDAGDMVATIKIIAFAVPEADIRRAADMLAGAISVAPVRIKTADLIVTEIPGGAGEKGVPAIADRLARLGISLASVVSVVHSEDTLVTALRQSASDLVLVLTGSATSDIADVAPAAIVQAGGRVERFGMPVDPGNLLVLGSLDQRPVIGLPGCARSPALNGADWVLARVACGIELRHEDIAMMGVGGLLKEIPTRPQPRRAKR